MMSPFRVILRPVVGLAESIFGKVDFVMAHGCGHPCSTSVVHFGHQWSRRSGSGSSIFYMVSHLDTWYVQSPILNVDLH